MTDPVTRTSPDTRHTEVAIPLHAEVLQIDKKAVETGRVRIIKTVREEQVEVDRSLTREQADVRRVEVNQFIHDVPNVRQEGDTLIVPIIEEVLVIEKRLMLKEELHITRRRAVEPHSQVMTLRTEEATVERVPGEHPQTHA